MKTKLPDSITTVAEAKKLLADLIENNECFHPEDDAHGIMWDTAKASHVECDQLNKLMEDIYNLPGNDGRHIEPMIFDPCEFIMSQSEN